MVSYMASILNYFRQPKFRDISIAIALFVFSFIIRLYGGKWDTNIANDAYMSRQAEYIYSYGHPAVPDPFSSAPLYQPGMAYLLAFAGRLFDMIPINFGMSSMTLSEGLIPPFLGASTIIVIFWLGRRFYDWKAGLVSGVFASVSLFLLMRTLKGYTFHNAFSLFLIISTIALVVRAMDILHETLPAKTKDKIIYVFWILLPAISIGLTGFTWGGYFVIHVILILYGLLITLHYFATKKTIYPLSYFWGFIIITLILGTFLSSILYPVRNLEEITRAMQIIGYTSGPIVYMFTADLQPPQFQVLEMFFGPYLILGIIILVSGMFLLYLKNNGFGLLLISAVGVSMILGLTRFHFMDIFSIFGYLGIGIGFIALIDKTANLSSRKRFAVQVLSVVAAIILFQSAAGPSIDTIKFSSLPNDYPGIGNADMMRGYSYIKNNTAPDALIINWWDYGKDIAYRAQRRTVIDQMYIEDPDVINVSRIIMGTKPSEGLKIARNYKSKHNNSEVYLLVGQFDGLISSVIEYCTGDGKEVFFNFNQTGNIEAMTPAASETNYYKLWNNQTMEGYDIVYANKEMKLFKLNI
ncbi:Oligosaccharyl transferase STT3 subunit [uncultured archaeon]|nr:Oligosaccharyl transferase STT3 subunit [uncultured archaeon]